jgi:hypothetical protein
MNLLGHEINLDFVYSVSPLFGDTITTEAYYFFFELSFKDGRSHKVEINNNFGSFSYNGNVYKRPKKDLTARQQKALEKKKITDLELIKKLRAEVVKEMAVINAQ